MKQLLPGSRNRLLLLSLCAIAPITLVAACGGSTSSGSSSACGLRIAVANSAEPLDPATIQTNASIELGRNIFGSLTVLDANGNEVPSLATSYTVSANGLTYTFHLRPGTKFSNGDPITAQDFAYSWNRTLSPKTASPSVFFLSMIQGGDAVTKGKATSASGIKAIDNETLQVTLTQPTGYFSKLVSTWPYWVVDPKVIAADGKGWVNPPNIVGSGAYRLTKIVGDQEYDLTANPSYFSGAPSVKNVCVTVIKDPTVRVARFKAGDFNAAFGLDAAALLQVKSNSSLKSDLHVRPQLGNKWLGMNNSKPPFNNEKVREAFSHAIDRSALVNTALGGLASPSSTFLPAGLPGAIANTPSQANAYGQYDPSQAKALLAQAGYPGGKGFPSVTLTTDDDATDATVVQYIQAELSKNLGINIGIKTVPHNSFNSQFSDPKNSPLLYLGGFTLDYPDAQEMLEYFGTSGPNGFVNYEHYDNPAFDALVNQAITVTDAAQREKLYNQAEVLFMSTMPVVPLYDNVAAWLTKPNVHGVGQSPQYMLPWESASTS